MMTRLRTSLVICVFLMLSAVQVFAASPYPIIDLGTLGGKESRAFGINDLGQVVGRAGVTTAGQRYHAFLYTGGVMTDLGTLGGDWSVAYDINNAGQIVGWAETSTDHNHAFRLSGGIMTDLQPLGANISHATGINDIGQVVGQADQRAFLWSNGSSQDLGTLGGAHAAAQSINNSGHIVGSATIADGTRHAFLYQDGNMTDLSAPGDSSVASFINSLGEVGGWYYPGERTFLVTGGGLIDIGTLGGTLSRGVAMNNSGHVVGWSAVTPSSDARHAFLYKEGTMFDLNTLIPSDSGWVLFEAHDINDTGQIVGVGYIDGESHAFLLIPEPATLSLLAIGGLGLMGRRRR